MEGDGRSDGWSGTGVKGGLIEPRVAGVGRMVVVSLQPARIYFHEEYSYSASINNKLFQHEDKKLCR